jgi:2-keto-4-pentenoate hydratase
MWAGLLPRIEAEFARILGADLAGPVGEDEALAAMAEVAVALEVIDSRVTDWRIRIVDTVGDNASAAAAVLGDLVRALVWLAEQLSRRS